MRHHIFRASEAEREAQPLLDWEREQGVVGLSAGSEAKPKPESTLADSRLHQFAEEVTGALLTLLEPESYPISLSLDFGIETQASTPQGSKRLILIPRIACWGGDERGASSRSSPDPSRRGRLGDKRMANIDRYSCLGTDQGGSLSGVSQYRSE